MPYEEADPTDPLELRGVALPADEGCTREMVYTFAEEFAGLGHKEEAILGLFRDAYFGSAHAALAELGEDEVRRIVRECVEVFGRFRVVDVAPLGPEECLDSFE